MHRCEGYRVLTAVDGEALYAAREEQPDLILLDLIMLGEDGVHISERLHGTRETADIPQERLLYAMVARWVKEP